MKLSLQFDWECTPEEFWSLYFDEDFVVRLHTEALGSTSAEVLSQVGDVAGGLVRTLRYTQRPNMPGPVRKIFGEEITSTEVSTFDPATSSTKMTLTPGTMADKTHIDGTIAMAGNGAAAPRRSRSRPGSRSSGSGPLSNASSNTRPATPRPNPSRSCAPRWASTRRERTGVPRRARRPDLWSLRGHRARIRRVRRRLRLREPRVSRLRGHRRRNDALTRRGSPRDRPAQCGGRASRPGPPRAWPPPPAATGSRRRHRPT